MTEVDLIGGFSRSVALDDFDDPSDESDVELGTENDATKKKPLHPPVLPSWVVWNPTIANKKKLDMNFLIVAVGQRASDILESIVDIKKMTPNGALFLPSVTYASKPHELQNDINSDVKSWSSLEANFSSSDTNFIYTTKSMEAACCLFHTAGTDGTRRRVNAADAYPVGSSLAKQLLDDSFNLNSMKQVVVFECLPADRYIGDRPASDLLSSPVTRTLRTTAYDGPTMAPIPDLEPPNLVSGLTADILCRCELKQQSCCLLTSYTDAPAGEILEATYEPLFRLLSRSIYFTVRFKEESIKVLREITKKRARVSDKDDLAGLYM